MKTANYVTGKRINIVLLVIAILWVLLMAAVGYVLLNAKIGNLPPSAFTLGLVIVLAGPAIEIITYLAFLTSMVKDKPWGYMGAGIVSGYILYNSLATLFRVQIGLNLMTIVSFLFWTILTILSFCMYTLAKKQN